MRNLPRRGLISESCLSSYQLSHCLVPRWCTRDHLLNGRACSCLVAGANLGGLADNDGAEPLCILLVALWLRKIPPFSAFDVITFFIFHNQHIRSFTNL